MATPTSLPATFVAGNVLTAAQMNALRGAFRILQVVSTTKADTFTTNSNSYVDVTGLSVAITPTSSSSKVLVIVNTEVGTNADLGLGVIQLVRDSTAISIGDTAGSRVRASTSIASSTAAVTNGYGITYLDSPATTSATTYKLQAAFIGGSGDVWFNRSQQDTDSGNRGRFASSITAIEVSA